MECWYTQRRRDRKRSERPRTKLWNHKNIVQWFNFPPLLCTLRSMSCLCFVFHVSREASTDRLTFFVTWLAFLVNQGCRGSLCFAAFDGRNASKLWEKGKRRAHPPQDQFNYSLELKNTNKDWLRRSFIDSKVVSTVLYCRHDMGMCRAEQMLLFFSFDRKSCFMYFCLLPAPKTDTSLECYISYYYIILVGFIFFLSYLCVGCISCCVGKLAPNRGKAFFTDFFFFAFCPPEESVRLVDVMGHEDVQ